MPWHDPQAARTRCDLPVWRGCEGSGSSRSGSRRSRAHAVSFLRLPGASCVRRIERPFSSMRCASWSRRSQIASAWFGSPMTACQSVTGSLAGDQRRGALGAVLDDLGQVAPLGVAQWREHPVVDGEQVELRPRARPCSSPVRKAPEERRGSIAPSRRCRWASATPRRLHPRLPREQVEVRYTTNTVFPPLRQSHNGARSSSRPRMLTRLIGLIADYRTLAETLRGRWS